MRTKLNNSTINITPHRSIFPNPSTTLALSIFPITNPTQQFSSQSLPSFQVNIIMAPNQETLMVGSYSKPNNNNSTAIQKPPRLSMEPLQRSLSDISYELRKEAAAIIDDHDHITKLPPISEVEDAKCECCGMCEECTPEYINGVRHKFSGKLVCGLCGEAVKEEMEKNGGKIEEALNEHMSACVRFNRLDRAYPVLYQAEAMKELFKKSSIRAKSMSPRVKGGPNKGGLTRSTSCIPAITRDVGDRKMVD